VKKDEYERRVVNMKKVVVEVASGLGLVNVIVEVAGTGCRGAVARGEICVLRVVEGQREGV
jgi:hypothetical protein